MERCNTRNLEVCPDAGNLVVFQADGFAVAPRGAVILLDESHGGNHRLCLAGNDIVRFQVICTLPNVRHLLIQSWLAGWHTQRQTGNFSCSCIPFTPESPPPRPPPPPPRGGKIGVWGQSREKE